MRYLGGDKDGATNLYNAILPLINFENRQCGLRATKIAMKEGGVIKYDTVRHPLEAVHPETRSELLRYASKLDLMALCWGK